MSEYKTELKCFTIMSYDKEAAYLQARHATGWQFESVTFPCIYKFKKCVPEDMTYQLDYNQEGLAHKEEYIKLFQDCGWEYIQDFTGYSYFRKPTCQMDGPEAIFCDDASRLDMMARIFKGRMMPLLLPFLLITLPQIVLQSQLKGFFSPLPIFFSLMLILYLLIFIIFGLQYYAYKKKLSQGGGNYDL